MEIDWGWLVWVMPVVTLVVGLLKAFFGGISSPKDIYERRLALLKKAKDADRPGDEIAVLEQDARRAYSVMTTGTNGFASRFKACGLIVLGSVNLVALKLVWGVVDNLPGVPAAWWWFPWLVRALYVLGTPLCVAVGVWMLYMHCRIGKAGFAVQSDGGNGEASGVPVACGDGPDPRQSGQTQ